MFFFCLIKRLFFVLDNKITNPFDLLRQRFPQLISKWKTMKQDGTAIKYE